MQAFKHSQTATETFQTMFDFMHEAHNQAVNTERKLARKSLETRLLKSTLVNIAAATREDGTIHLADLSRDDIQVMRGVVNELPD